MELTYRDIDSIELYSLKPEVLSSWEELGRLLVDDFLEIPSTGAPLSKTGMFWLSPHGCACGVSLNHLH